MPGTKIFGCLDPTTGIGWVPVKVNAGGVIAVDDASMFSPLLLGICDPAMAPSLNTILCPNLKDLPDDTFSQGFVMKVLRNVNAPATAPQGDVRRITNYDGTTGTFTTDNFSANVEANDLVLIIHSETDKIGATYSHPNGVGEQTAFTFDPAGLRTEILCIWLDLVNLTQNATIRVKHRIDGANFRTFDTLNWTPAMDDGVYITGFAVNNQVQVTIQSAVAEGAARDIPYYYIYRTVE